MDTAKLERMLEILQGSLESLRADVEDVRIDMRDVNEGLDRIERRRKERRERRAKENCKQERKKERRDERSSDKSVENKILRESKGEPSELERRENFERKKEKERQQCALMRLSEKREKKKGSNISNIDISNFTCETRSNFVSSVCPILQVEKTSTPSTSGEECYQEDQTKAYEQDTPPSICGKFEKVEEDEVNPLI